ncbi:hypothetical protein QBC37DRAFT_429958 [Rhypophila decipiens]|uniref:Uncharacterized protein n=1 Tax=Rhypophila decipiens TaxID=261697 RepID=A0AAN6Y1T3_9PEZI|nr:hypothetical protein QBC37DRAFT_429958 [Rhypophila decipiens]
MSRQQDARQLQKGLIHLNLFVVNVTIFLAAFNGFQYGKTGDRVCAIESVVECFFAALLCWTFWPMSDIHESPRKDIMKMPAAIYLSSTIASGGFLIINGIMALNGTDPNGIEDFAVGVTVAAAVNLTAGAFLHRLSLKTRRFLEEDMNAQTLPVASRQERGTEVQTYNEEQRSEAAFKVHDMKA